MVVEAVVQALLALQWALAQATLGSATLVESGAECQQFGNQEAVVQRQRGALAEHCMHQRNFEERWDAHNIVGPSIAEEVAAAVAVEEPPLC
mmetsp:Transcript_40593/g.87138  ORF Transcript_40593/g.87138 Transcript_40593/m.87138 type:complete len:92 (-) Transcript_40593:291-566(-)